MKYEEFVGLSCCFNIVYLAAFIDPLVAALLIIVLSFSVLGYFSIISNVLYNAVLGIETTGYFIKESQVYHFAKPIQGADADSFEWQTIENNDSEYYAKDQNHIYYQGHVVKDADPQQFRPLKDRDRPDKSTGYFRDSQHVYFRGKVLSGLTPETVEVTHHGGLKSP